MTIVLTTLHVLVCFSLVLIILLQAGKGAGMGAAFGGSSQTVFGSTGRATFLTKLTVAAAVMFGLTCLGLSITGSKQTKSVMDRYEGVERTQTAPVEAAPGTPITIPPSPGMALPEDAAPPSPQEAPPAVETPITIPPATPGPAPQTPEGPEREDSP